MRKINFIILEFFIGLFYAKAQNVLENPIQNDSLAKPVSQVLDSLEIEERGLVLLNLEELENQENAAFPMLGAVGDPIENSKRKLWGAYWVANRGLQNSDQSVFLNDFSLKNPFDRKIDFQQISGLNALQRNPLEVASSMQVSKIENSQLGTSLSYQSNPFLFPKKGIVNFSNTNQNYNYRLGVSLWSGELKNNWAYFLSATARIGDRVDQAGAYYNGYSGALSLGKKFGQNHLLYSSFALTSIERSRGTAYTQEIFDLKGNNYNPFWGMYNGEIKHAKIDQSLSPLLQFNYQFSNQKWQLFAGLSHQQKTTSRAQLETYTPFGESYVRNPLPNYYQNLPSYFNGDDFYKQYYLFRESESVSQINWENIYLFNQESKTGAAKYYMAKQVSEDQTTSATIRANVRIDNKWELATRLAFSDTTSEMYSELSDLLGAQYVLDKDDFNDYQLFDLNQTKEQKTEGDKLNYHYQLQHQSAKIQSNAVYKADGFNLDFGASLGWESFAREGYFLHFNPALQSLGQSPKSQWLNWGVFGELQKEMGNFSRFGVSAKHFVQTPELDAIFMGQRYSNLLWDKTGPEEVSALQLSYFFKKSKWELALKTYGFLKNNASLVQFYYTQGEVNNLVTERISGAKLRYLGLESFASYQWNDRLKSSLLISLNQNTYQNNPDLLLFESTKTEPVTSYGKTYLKNREIPSFRTGLGLQLDYTLPSFAWIGLGFNYLSGLSASPAAILSTENFYTSNPVPLTSGMDANYFREITKPREFEGAFLVNLSAGKSFKVGDHFAGVMLFVNNLLDNQNYITGGFQQSRY
ncbi:MAG: hypothetical protein C4K58_00850 [Flavobacteriaceae bacterium]|nr:MAG: hypothetical protein C4K58_00850 [Flavobacteriaceae bacterium]